MATDPPIVPRLRTAGSPIWAASSASAGKSPAPAATCAWVAAPPTRNIPSRTDTPCISATPLNDTSFDGMASRCFSVGISVCPPLSACAPSEASAAAPIGGADLGVGALRQFGRHHPQTALIVKLFDDHLPERQANIVLDYQLLKADGRPDASGTVASMYDTSAANVRQIRRRAMQKLAPVLATPQYAPIAHVHLLTA